MWIFNIIRLKILIILLLRLVLHNYCKSVLLILLINIIVHQALDAKTRKGQMSAIDMFAVKASTSKPEKSSSKKENATQERKVEVRFLFWLGFLFSLCPSLFEVYCWTFSELVVQILLVLLLCFSQKLLKHYHLEINLEARNLFLANIQQVKCLWYCWVNKLRSFSSAVFRVTSYPLCTL